MQLFTRPDGTISSYPSTPKDAKRFNKRFYDNGENEVFSEYTVAEEYQSYPGVVHGGIVAAMLDEVVGRVAMIDDHHHFMMSVKLEVKYRAFASLRIFLVTAEPT